MNENKLDFHSDYGSRSSCQYFGIRQQPWNMGPCNNQPLSTTCVGVGVGIGGGERGGGGEQVLLPYLTQAKPSTTIISRFESPASAFYATEIFMGFPQYDSHQVGNPSSNYLMPTQLSIIKNNNNDMEFPLYQSSKEGLFFDSVNDQNTPNNNNNFELPNTLQAIKSQLNGDLQCNGSPEKSNKIPCGNFPPNNFLPVEQHKLFIDDAAPLTRNIPIPKANQESMVVACSSFNSPVQQLNFSSQQEKLSPTISAGSMSTATGSLVSNGPIASSKTRIRWTQDLHEKFVECVNRLGGAEKATPKAILRLMDSDGLTIFHVKSHLQKYRIAKYMPESTQGKSEKRTNAESVHLDVKAGLQIKEALQLQLDVQRRLHEQLEIQRKLQLQIEEQGKQLKMMFDRQQKSNNIENSSKYNNNNNEVTILEGTGISYFPTKKS